LYYFAHIAHLNDEHIEKQQEADSRQRGGALT
jgi:hypothetical protein